MFFKTVHTAKKTLNKQDRYGHPSNCTSPCLGLDDLLSTPALPPLTQDLIGLCSGQFSSQPIHCSMLEASQEAGVDYNASQVGCIVSFCFFNNVLFLFFISLYILLLLLFY